MKCLSDLFIQLYGVVVVITYYRACDYGPVVLVLPAYQIFLDRDWKEHWLLCCCWWWFCWSWASSFRARESTKIYTYALSVSLSLVITPLCLSLSLTVSLCLTLSFISVYLSSSFSPCVSLSILCVFLSQYFSFSHNLSFSLSFSFHLKYRRGCAECECGKLTKQLQRKSQQQNNLKKRKATTTTTTTADAYQEKKHLEATAWYLPKCSG